MTPTSYAGVSVRQYTAVTLCSLVVQLRIGYVSKYKVVEIVN